MSLAGEPSSEQECNMSFTLETIGAGCANTGEYHAGKQLMPQVKLDSIQSFWRGEVTIQAHVTEDGRSYSVSFRLQEGEYQSFRCSCGEYARGLCRHGAAASLAYYELTHRKSQLSQATSPAMQKVLQCYQELGIADMMQSRQEGRAILIPLLSYRDQRAWLSFKIGNGGRSYVIRDLMEFYFHMKWNETVTYGKTWSFVHSEWAFARENVPVLRFVLGALENELQYFRQYNPYRPDTGKKCRELLLTKEQLDSFLALYQGQRIAVAVDSGYERQTEVVEENPRLHIRISEEADGYQLSVQERIRLLEGKERLYLLFADKLCCTDAAYARSMAPLLREAERGKGSAYMLNRRDMPALCGQLLPCISKWVNVDKGELKLEQYMPKPVEVEFSFDVNDEGAVACEEKLLYDDFSFNPVKGSSVPVSIYRDYTGEYRIKSVVEKYFKYYDADKGVLLLYEEDEIFRLLDAGMQEFLQLGTVYVSEAFKSVRIAAPPKLSVGVSMAGNMLELTIESGGISEEELAELLKNYRLKKKYYRLRSGEFIRIENTALAAFSETAEGLKLSAGELKQGRISAPLYRAMYVENMLSDSGIDFKRSRDFRSLIRACKNTGDSDFEVPDSLAGTLRGYQKAGYRWLRTLSQFGFGGILADEMGLGKTIQVIALLLSVRQELKKPALIICPASLVYNWENELHRFAPGLSASTISGNAQERERALSSKRNAQVWITSYDLLRRDLEKYKGIEFSYQIIDEAQVIKNHSTQSARAVKAIRAEYRFALTGTPIENRLSELWSIFDYLMPGYLYSYACFREEFELPVVRDEDEKASERLRRLLKPFVLRRLKQEVLKELPPKLETVVYSRMETEQRQLYAAYASKVKEELSGKTPEEYREGRMQILAALMRLRQICCDPSLCYDNYDGGSAKLNTCIELIEEGLEGGHRFLLFSQFTTMLEKIRRKLEEQGVICFLLTGATQKQERVRLAERFNEGEGSVFLISLKAGGTGLNLTGADMVIHYDPWWNLAAQDQATDRAHRIGQKNRVTVWKLVAKGTIEENIIRLQESKSKLAEQILGGSQSGAAPFTQEEIMELLAGLPD